MFPIIRHIDDIWPFLNREEFKLIEDPAHNIVSINYGIVTGKEMFDSPLLLEGRGIKFNLTTGDILARPFHKFFNRGEWIEREAIYATGPFTIWEKRDGSMVHPVLTPLGVKLCTRAGVTDVSQLAEYLVDNTLRVKFKDLLDLGITPIMEFTSPRNPIVIKYTEAKLTLLAVRDNVSGLYKDNLKFFGDYLNLPIAKEYINLDLNSVKEWKDAEGVVLVFPNGERLKIKADDYCLKGRVKDALAFEKDVLLYILENELDDLIPLLSNEDIERIEAYRTTVLTNIRNNCERIASLVRELSPLSRKEVALKVSNMELTKEEEGVFWDIYKGREPLEAMKRMVLRYTTNGPKLEQIRWLLNTQW